MASTRILIENTPDEYFEILAGTSLDLDCVDAELSYDTAVANAKKRAEKTGVPHYVMGVFDVFKPVKPPIERTTLVR